MLECNACLLTELAALHKLLLKHCLSEFGSIVMLVGINFMRSKQVMCKMLALQLQVIQTVLHSTQILQKSLVVVDVTVGAGADVNGTSRAQHAQAITSDIVPLHNTT